MFKIFCRYDELKDPSELKNHPRNRNSHPQDQIERLVLVFKENGIRHPIVVSKRSGFITKGHGRKLASIRAGIKEYPVEYQDYESEEQEYQDIIADNALQLWSELDLSGINLDLAELGPFNVEALGLKDFEIEPADKYQDKDADEVPEVKENIHNVQLGQIWKLGEHRLMCGDSTDSATVEKLMNGEKADMVFTDPPYGMFLDTDYTSMDSGMGKNKKFKPVAGDNEDFVPGLINTIFNSFSYCKEMFLFGADYYAELIPDRNKGSWVIWDKSVTESMDKGFGSAWESCWSKQKHKRTFARILWRGLYGKKDDQKTRTHPTQKPVHLAEFFFDNWGKETKSVVDIYGGSGSTLIACEKTNRKCFMMELDPHYCSVIIERFQTFSGKKAELICEK